MKLSGTSVIKLEKFIINLKELAGTTNLTRLNYDFNTDKVCSYAHVRKMFKLTWNDCLGLAGIKINRKLKIPIKQGRKPKIKNYKTIECLYCLKEFVSKDPKYNRICNNCKPIVDEQDAL